MNPWAETPDWVKYMTSSAGRVSLWAVAAFFAVGQPIQAQTAGERAHWADSVREAIDAAVSRADADAQQGAAALSQRLLALSPADGLLLHYRGYALFQLAMSATRDSSVGKRRAWLDSADDALRISAEALPLAETHALRASIIGQIIGMSHNPFVAMRLGPWSGSEMKRALELGPNNPRVWLIRGMNTMHTPRSFGGGAAAAEEQLKKAATLFASDTARAPRPTWGKADVLIVLGELHLEQRRYAEARVDLEGALALQPENKWVRDKLLPAAMRSP